MSQYEEFLTDLGNRMTEGLERFQEFQLEQIRNWQTTFGQMASAMPAPQVPEGVDIPSFDSVVKANFSFAERMLENQRKFAMTVSEALATPTEETEETKED